MRWISNVIDSAMSRKPWIMASEAVLAHRRLHAHVVVHDVVGQQPRDRVDVLGGERGAEFLDHFAQVCSSSRGAYPDPMATSKDDLILVSVDDHICEPADMFDAHVPDEVPRPGAARRRRRRTARSSGTTATSAGRNLGLNAVAGKPPEMFNVNPMRYEDMRPGCYDVHERVRDMSAGGQLAGLNFPNWTGFSGQVLNQGPDRDVNLVMIQAYNDWHVDEWCGAYPERFIPCGILPLFDVDEAAEGGAPPRGQGLPRGHVLREPGRPRHAEHPHRRLGSAVRGVQRRPAPCCAATSARRRRARRPSPDAPPPVPMNLSSVMTIYTLGDLLWADFWHRFPDLRFSLTEGDIGWIPYFLLAGRAHARPAQRVDAPRARRRACRPTELFHERILCCFINDRVGVKLLDEFNVDNVCWESDYPHSDSSWPDAPEKLAALFAGPRRRGRRQDHARERDAPLPVRPVRGPAARAVHRRRAAGRGGRRRHRHPRRPPRRRHRPDAWRKMTGAAAKAGVSK